MFSRKSTNIDEKYVEEKVAKIDEGDVEMAAKNQQEISDKILNANALKKYTELGKVMFGMLQDYRKGIYKDVPWFTIAAIAFALLYVLNPLDMMPDFIPGVGYVDDFAVLTFSLRFMETDLHKYLDWKLEEGEEA
ncbi:YkvA family protein [Salegentibacter sediminis]|uniref:YkvA family protein n=1 Tax=Salegentibacter sediminis TaxID=1930251 RepID=UPI0009BDA995|nr:YkvA family protein [Salegentibacter sediminis]